MALISYDNTGNRLWSKNPIIIKLLAWGEPVTTSVILTIDGPGRDVTVSYPSEALAIFIPINKLIDYLFPLQYTPPVLKVGSSYNANAQQSDRVKDLRIGWRLSTDAAGTETWVNKKLIDGGVGTMNQANAQAVNIYSSFDAAKFFPNAGSAFLTYLPSGRKVDASMNGWIPFYLLTNVRPSIKYVIKFVDGTDAISTKLFPVLIDYTDTYWHLPFGIDQADLDPTGIGIYKVQMMVVAGDDGEIVLGSYFFYYDYTPVYDWLDVYYRNSLGGWDAFRFDGRVELSSDAERKEHEQTVLFGAQNGMNPYYESKLRVKWKLNTRYISAKEMAALNDLLNSKDIRINFKNEWLPIRCLTKSLNWRDSKDGLYAQAFEFETSGDFDIMPREIVEFFALPPELR